MMLVAVGGVGELEAQDLGVFLGLLQPVARACGRQALASTTAMGKSGGSGAGSRRVCRGVAGPWPPATTMRPSVNVTLLVDQVRLACPSPPPGASA